jgi:hypothetical protein
MVHKVLQEGHPVVRDGLPAQPPLYDDVITGRQSRRHKVKQVGLKRVHELLVTRVAKVSVFSQLVGQP